MTTTVHHEGDGLNRKYWNPFLLFVSLFFVWPLCLAFIKVMLLSEPFIFPFHCVSSVTSLKAIWWVWKQDGGSSASSPPFCSDLGSEYQEGRCDCFSRQSNELPPVCRRMMIGKGSFISVNICFIFFWRSSPMKVIWSPLLKMVFPGQGRWTYSKSEKWFGWRVTSSDYRGGRIFAPRWYTLPWPVCPR